MPQRPIRPLAIVASLALGDYLLWNWSLGANHDIVALVAGATLIPLLIALAWLVVVSVVRLLAHAARHSHAHAARRSQAARRSGAAARDRSRAHTRGPGRSTGAGTGVRGALTTASADKVMLGDPAAVAGEAASPSSKLAA